MLPLFHTDGAIGQSRCGNHPCVAAPWWWRAQHALPRNYRHAKPKLYDYIMHVHEHPPQPTPLSAHARLRFTMQTPTVAFAKYGYSVVHTNCLSNFSHIHEIGHNMGANHDKDNAGTGHAYAYAHRYCDGSTP